MLSIRKFRLPLEFILLSFSAITTLIPEDLSHATPALWVGSTITWVMTTRSLEACINSPASRRLCPLVLVHVLLLNFLFLFGTATWHSPLSTVMAQLDVTTLLQLPLASTLYAAYLLVPLVQWCALLETLHLKKSVKFAE